jgi:hypothetical protein
MEQPAVVVHVAAPADKAAASYTIKINEECWGRVFAVEFDVIGVVVFVRFGRSGPEDGDPVEIRQLDLCATVGGGLASRVLREVPIARWEAAVNNQDIRTQMEPLLPDYWTKLAERAQLPGREWDVFFNAAPDEFPKPYRPRLRVRVPSGTVRRPDSFYQQIAERFLYLQAHSRRPAQELADANEVPVSTVHRWVKEARVRGLLPGGQRKGKEA